MHIGSEFLWHTMWSLFDASIGFTTAAMCAWFNYDNCSKRFSHCQPLWTKCIFDWFPILTLNWPFHLSVRGQFSCSMDLKCVRPLGRDRDRIILHAVFAFSIIFGNQHNNDNLFLYTFLFNARIHCILKKGRWETWGPYIIIFGSFSAHVNQFVINDVFNSAIFICRKRL